MPVRTITVKGQRWEVRPSGRVTQYDKDEFGLMFIRRDGDKLIVKPGNNPEAPLMARSQTRFQDPRGPVFEFELDGQGKVIRAFLDQQTPKGLQRLVLERK